MRLFARFLTPDVDRHLLEDEGEYIIDEVPRHWAASVLPVLMVAAAIPCFVAMVLMGPYFWVGLVAGVAFFIAGMIGIHQQFMDRFVITNMRVFRVHGILSQHLATMPMTRILDISVLQPFIGRLLGYGHITFESAAQDQGLREIRYVGHPEERDLTIQRVIQRAGLRANIRRVEDDPDARDGN
ncbi:PH domain-containing protein [Propionibacteriaceae bacterium G1746]|uniref:PH domain-containing protein n=1 Tax=Aestuariimicrobium sp. G57 TaxID=3418485 RepID=UPI003C29D763